MSHQHPPIDLDGFQRLSDLERCIWYSPASIMVYLIGLSGAVYEIWNFQSGLAAMPRNILVGHGLLRKV